MVLPGIFETRSYSCHLNRDIPAILRDSGFQVEKLTESYIPGWKPASFNFWGTAKTS
jgi:hypothetical protein